MMKKIFFIALALTFSFSAIAEEALKANIKVSPEWGKTQCSAQPGRGIALSWGGVTDGRKTQAVGVLKKGDEETDIVLAGSLDSIIGETVKAVLTNCGYEIKDKRSSGVTVSVDVQEFFAGSKKGFFTGETDANGSLVIHLSNGNSTYDLNVSAGKTDKRLRKKNITQQEKVLTELLESLAVQIGESPSLFEEIKKLAAK